MRKIIFAENYLYHIYNRGTEKRSIFLDNNDYRRFIHYLHELNDADRSHNLSRNIEGGRTLLKANPRNPWVKIIAFCLMPNHFHLILEQSQETGIVKFMHKVGTAYTMYFNQKNKRSGVLFQGKFKAVLVESDNYLMHLSQYIHVNPVEIIEPGWKTEGIKNWDNVNSFLENYRWSSYLDYIGIKNFPLVIDREIISHSFHGEKSYKNFINQWLNSDLEFIKEEILE